jgi:hypothetical protein
VSVFAPSLLSRFIDGLHHLTEFIVRQAGGRTEILLKVIQGKTDKVRARGEGQLRFVLLPKGVARGLRQIPEFDLDVHPRRTSEIAPSDAVAFFRDLWPDLIGVNDLPIIREDFRCIWIDVQASRPAPRFPFFKGQRVTVRFNRGSGVSLWISGARSTCALSKRSDVTAQLPHLVD